jgi:hypothetical protein
MLGEPPTEKKSLVLMAAIHCVDGAEYFRHGGTLCGADAYDHHKYK